MPHNECVICRFNIPQPGEVASAECHDLRPPPRELRAPVVVPAPRPYVLGQGGVVPVLEPPTRLVVPAPASGPAEADPVHTPAHYTSGPIEVIEIIEGWNLGFRLGNCVKYILRSPLKGATLQDLKKAYQYLGREIAALEGRKGWK